MNKIFLAQIDTIAGDLAYNFNKIQNAIHKATEAKAELVIFPELSLFGAFYGDIPKRHKSLFALQKKYLQNIADLSIEVSIIIGYLDEKLNSKIAIFKNGKQMNPQENSSQIFELNNKKFFIKSYSNDNILNTGADAIILLDASPSRTTKEQILNTNLSQIAKQSGLPLIYVNQVGYANDFIFEGASRVFDNMGQLTARCKYFEEDFLELIDFNGKIEKTPIGLGENNSFNFSFNYENDLHRTYLAIVNAVRGYFYKNGFKRAVLGLSGGLDSTVCATILADALGAENVVGISMPTKITSCASKKDAQILADNLGIKFLEIPILNEINIFSKDLKEIFSKLDIEQYAKSTTFENIQARTRATILWSISNECKSMLPIATSDKSELYIGYATINGDMSGGFAPIADVPKTKLFALADFLNRHRNVKNAIPQSILEKPPGAELKFDEEKGRTITAEEDNMPYPFLDEIIWHVENKNYGYKELMEHEFIFEKENNLSKKQKEEWILKFFDKAQKAVFKWHLLPPSVIIDAKSINSAEYKHPIISKFLAK